MYKEQAIVLAELLVRYTEDRCGHYWNFGMDAPKECMKRYRSAKKLLKNLKSDK